MFDLVLHLIKRINDFVKKVEKLSAGVVRYELKLAPKQRQKPVQRETLLLRQPFNQLRNHYLIAVADLIYWAEQHPCHDKVFGGFDGAAELGGGELFEQFWFKKDAGGPYAQGVLHYLLFFDCFTFGADDGGDHLEDFLLE